MTNIDISRRALLGGLAAAGLPTTVSAIETAPEFPIERVERLAFELSEAMNDYMDRRFCARVYPSKRFPSYPVAFTRIEIDQDPLTRLAIKIAEVKRALFYLTGKQPVDASKIEGGHFVVALGVLPEHMVHLKWFYDDGSPLLAEDAGSMRTAIKLHPPVRI